MRKGVESQTDTGSGPNDIEAWFRGDNVKKIHAMLNSANIHPCTLAPELITLLSGAIIAELQGKMSEEIESFIIGDEADDDFSSEEEYQKDGADSDTTIESDDD